MKWQLFWDPQWIWTQNLPLTLLGILIRKQSHLVSPRPCFRSARSSFQRYVNNCCKFVSKNKNTISFLIIMKTWYFSQKMYFYSPIPMVCYNFLKTKYFLWNFIKHEKMILCLLWFPAVKQIRQVNWNNHENFLLLK